MNIKDLRVLSGMSQSQFASYFGIPKDTIQNWEQQRRKCPDYVFSLIDYKLKKERIIGDRDD